MPDLNNSTAVAQIVNLALNSTNPEVKQGFQLILQYGTPNPDYFVYQVSPWNAELWVLYHLSEDVVIQKNDIIALAIAIDDGVFMVMGDNSVQNQVRLDDANMLRLSRELMEWQEERHMALLSALPLDAALYWAWRGTTTMDRGGYWVLGGGPYPLQSFLYSKMSLVAYLWDTIDPQTLRDMRADAEQHGWTTGTVDYIVERVEEYFYFTGYTLHWKYYYLNSTGGSDTIKNVDGVNVEYGEVQNTDWQYYQRFKKGLPAVGSCVAETAFVDAWLKSMGIAASSIGRYPLNGGYTGHNHSIYYNPVSKVWKAYSKQVELGLTEHPPTDVQEFDIRKLPINYVFDSYYEMQLTLPQIQTMFVQNGVPSQQMQQWVIPN